MAKQEQQTVEVCDDKMESLESRVERLERRPAFCEHSYINIQIYHGGWFGNGKCASCGATFHVAGYPCDKAMKKVHRLLKKSREG